MQRHLGRFASEMRKNSHSLGAVIIQSANFLLSRSSVAFGKKPQMLRNVVPRQFQWMTRQDGKVWGARSSRSLWGASRAPRLPDSFLWMPPRIGRRERQAGMCLAGRQTPRARRTRAPGIQMAAIQFGFRLHDDFSGISVRCHPSDSCLFHLPFSILHPRLYVPCHHAMKVSM